MVQDLDHMMVERLLLYQKHNNKRLPDRIVVFRDGVSEVSANTLFFIFPLITLRQGQFRLVLKHELPKFLDAFKKLQGGTYRPKLSIVVCGKRHHVKGFGTSQDHITKNGNTVPGTVVDKGITDVFNHDFYLQVNLTVLRLLILLTLSDISLGAPWIARQRQVNALHCRI